MCVPGRGHINQLIKLAKNLRAETEAGKQLIELMTGETIR